jgi:DNA polymerase-1
MKVLGFDIETTSLKAWSPDARILTAAVVGEHESLAASPGTRNFSAIQVDAVENPDVVLVGHNLIGFDIPFWQAHVGPVRAKYFDTRVAYGLIDESGNNNTLDGLAELFLGKRANLEMKAKRKMLAELPIAEVLEYNREDSELSYQLYDPLVRLLEENGRLELFEWIMECGRTLVGMMTRGTAIDTAWVEAESAKMDEEIESLEVVLRHDVDGIPEDFNPRSGKQLGWLLFEHMGMPVLKRTKNGAPVTSAEVLKQLRSQAPHEIIAEYLDSILKYKKLLKMRGTYLRPLAGKHYGTDGRIHTGYNMAKSSKGGTVTGRLSSHEPNLQNIPRDKRVKGAFVPSEGMRMFEADYSQLEIRVAAWYSQEPKMLDAFAKGRDIHTAALSDIEGRPYDELVAELEDGNEKLKEQRTLVKRVNFGVLYGVGSKKLVELMRDMGIEITLSKAQSINRKWFATYDKLAEWIKDVKEYVNENLQIETPTGRVRHLPGAHEFEQDYIRWSAQRQAVNFLVQSLASDITMLGIQGVDRYLTTTGLGHLLLTVHDSVLGEYEPKHTAVSLLAPDIDRVMTDGVNQELKERFGIPALPLAVDVDTNLRRWGD